MLFLIEKPGLGMPGPCFLNSLIHDRNVKPVIYAPHSGQTSMLISFAER